jgi:hypothetical protein
MGEIDAQMMEKALNTIVRRHEILRTSFPTLNDGSPLQVVEPEDIHFLPQIDLQEMPRPYREQEWQTWAYQEARRPFDLTRLPLLRAQLLHLTLTDHVFVLTMHHIITDGWSMQVLIRELAVVYDAYRKKRPSPLAPLPMQYSDFAEWQHVHLRGSIVESQLDYWKMQLAGAVPLTLPYDRTSARAPDSWEAGKISFSVPYATSDKIKYLGRSEGATLFMTLLAACQVLLYYWTGSDDIVVGTDAANRNLPGLDILVGYFVNQLVLRTKLDRNPSFLELLQRTRQTSLGAYAHQDVPFESVVKALRPDRDLNRLPLFAIKVALQDVPVEGQVAGNITMSTISVDSGKTNLDVILLLSTHHGRIGGTLKYARDLFDPSSMKRFVSQYSQVLHYIADNPNLRLSDLHEILTTSDERAMRSDLDEYKRFLQGSLSAWRLDRGLRN